jgi:phosphoribosylaminoimidazole carboxylase PurE protein
MKETVSILEEFDISHEVYLTSAHRSPERTISFAKELEQRGIQIIIVGAGHAAHLAGVIASHTPLPVIGVPIDSSSLEGLDALLSTVQMPGGIPVATMAIGKSGAKNGALMAIRILALEDEGLREKLNAYIKKMAKTVEEKQKAL